MHDISTDLFNHLKSETLTIAYIIKVIKKNNGNIIGFTNHDKDLFFENLLYESSSTFNLSEIKTVEDLTVDNLESEIIIDNDRLLEEEILAGDYDSAKVEVSIVNYADLSQGRLILRTGYLGEITLSAGKFITEIRGMKQNLLQSIGQIYSPKCRTILGGAKCGVDLNNFMDTGKILDVISNKEIKINITTYANGYFNNGILEFTSGKNIGHKLDIKNYDSEGYITIKGNIFFTPQQNVNIKLFTGCDKTFTSCCNKFNNSINFRGEPYIPGNEEVLKVKIKK